MTYDTRRYLPTADGTSNWSADPLPSFGPTWSSALYKRASLQAGTDPGGPFTSVLMQRGGGLNLSASSLGGIDTCGGGANGGSALAYRSATVPTVSAVYNTANLAGGLKLTDQSALQQETYDGLGNITGIAFAQGGALQYTYNTSVTATAPSIGLLTSIADQFGRSVTFAYEQPTNPAWPPRIIGVTSPDGQQVAVHYSTAGNMDKVTWPDTTQVKFVYDDTRFAWALTGLVDELDARYATYAYDAFGRASMSEHAGGAERVDVPYGSTLESGPHWAVTATLGSNDLVCRIHSWVVPASQGLTDGGVALSYGVAEPDGLPRVVSKAQPGGSGCAASTSAMAYDIFGNVTHQDDFNGNRVCYAYDTTRNLRTIALEGLTGGVSGKNCPVDLAGYAPSASDPVHPERKTTTVWHPHWVLKAREAEPKKITTWVYNGQPDPIAGGTASCAPATATLPDGKPLAVLCARYEQATTDASGASGLGATVTGATRAWRYTYNAFGQFLSATTPKLSAADPLSHTTTYTYYPSTSFTGAVGHTTGDLATTADPKGRVTTYTAYDKAGRLLSSTDANGTVTTQSWWPRGWLHTQTVTPAAGGGVALTTTYDYWPTGLLKTVTLPDASVLSYGYDDAHRLTDVTDGAGNKLHYVLDNAGNRTNEQVSDASNTLASTVARVFDALNRLQSSTGAAREGQ